MIQIKPRSRYAKLVYVVFFNVLDVEVKCLRLDMFPRTLPLFVAHAERVFLVIGSLVGVFSWRRVVTVTS